MQYFYVGCRPALGAENVFDAIFGIKLAFI